MVYCPYMATECIFCKIVAGDLPAAVVYETDTELAFLDINPVNAGHTLVIPKKHHTDIHDTPEETLVSLIRTVKKVAHAVNKGVSANGINIHVNNARAAGQIVPHMHMHVIPRFENDGIAMWKQHPYPEGEMNAVQQKIRNAF